MSPENKKSLDDLKDDIRNYLKTNVAGIDKVSKVTIRAKNYCGDLFYWRAMLKEPVSITINGIKEEYTHVIFTPYKIDEKIREKAITQSKPQRPDFDRNTGNIHPDIFNAVEWIKDPKIKQIILVHRMPCGYYGPKFIQNVCIDTDSADYFEPVPKACYYPLIDKANEEACKDIDAYKMLNEIWDCLDKWNNESKKGV